MKKIFKDITLKAKVHGPEILISMGVVGMATSTVLAVRATPKALQLLEDKKYELNDDYLTGKEIVQAAWKPYVPATVLGILSAGCIVAGTATNVKRNAALATMYAISENTIREYQRKTEQIVGKDKAAEIRKEVNKARVNERPVVVSTDDSQYLIKTGYGDTIIFDSLSGRYFKSSMNSIEKAVNKINRDMLSDHYATLNDFYSELNIPTIDAGNMIGWEVDNEMIDITFDSDVAESGLPYLVLTYHNRPRPLPGRYRH